MSAHRDYDVVVSKEPEQENYPPHVKNKLRAYENAGLKYRIANDSVMRRSIVFHGKKLAFPDKWEKRIENIFRLIDPINNKEYIVYDTYERVFDDNNVKYEDNITYGLDESIKTEPKFDRNTGMLKDREKVLHNNVFTEDYNSRKMQEIFDSISDTWKDYPVSMFIADISRDAEKLYTGQRVKVLNRDYFINRSYDELLLMKLTATTTPEEAVNAAKTLRGDPALATDVPFKDKILAAEARISSVKKEKRG